MSKKLVGFEENINAEYVHFIANNMKFNKCFHKKRESKPHGYDHFGYNIKIDNENYNCFIWPEVELNFSKLEIIQENKKSFLVHVEIDKYNFDIRQYICDSSLAYIAANLSHRILEKIINTIYFDDRKDIFDYSKTKKVINPFK